MNQRLASILLCPHCRSQLYVRDQHVQCGGCGNLFPLQAGVPVFLTESAELVGQEHRSNPLGRQFEDILRDGRDFVLNIGAGNTTARYPNCIEFEHKIFHHTDVVGDAHHLPFRDQAFDRVFAFNVFEHLRDPKMAAAEIFRVLKPGGALALHTAFLQALHEEPAHFYNATAYGVREWFAQFEIERCDVSGNFSPGYMLAFLMSNVLEAVRLGTASVEEQTMLGKTSIGEWAAFWARGNAPPAGFNVLQNLAQSLQQRIAAGFELIARKPVV